MGVPGSRYGTPRSRGMSMRTPRVTIPFFRLWIEFFGCPFAMTSSASRPLSTSFAITSE